MFKQTSIALEKAGVLNSLVTQYLKQSKDLSEFYQFYPDLEGFKSLLQTNLYQEFDRSLLVKILSAQAGSVKNTSEASKKNIGSLAEQNTFTITTGHQLCLFTGPLYFIYKIFSAINLAERLTVEFPDKNFVPVYWMATEDHDFAEVNHFHVNAETVKWESRQQGAVGSFETGELTDAFALFKKALGISENAKKLVTLFENAYLKHNNLADATRFVVNELFGEYGIVIVDGNDKNFKAQFKNEFREDIFSSHYYKQISESSQRLKEKGFHVQVNGREINCFFLDKNLRARIERDGKNFRVVDTELIFTEKELEDIIEKSPEKISPNVVLRPLYQQKILPNIAYVGGPGELAYWLELKKMFDLAGTMFPILIPRNFFTVTEKRISEKINKLNLRMEEFFKSEAELIKTWQTNSNNLFALSAEEEKLKSIYAEILEKIKPLDGSLSGKVLAEQQKSINGIETMVLKTNRAIRRKSEAEISQIKTIKNYFSPSGVPQERYENFSSFYLLYGQSFFVAAKEAANPFIFDMILLEETHRS